MRGSEDVRFRVLAQQKAQLEMVLENLDKTDKAQVKFCEKLQQFCDNREKILNNKKLFPCFKNLLVYRHLKKVSTIHFRGILGDFVYAIKR